MPVRTSRRAFMAGTALVGAGIAINQYARILQYVQRYGISAIAAGQHFSVVVRDGQVYVWGNNDSGQCDVPVNLPRITQVSAGESHAIALSADGDVFIWGGQQYSLQKLPPIVQVMALSDNYTHMSALLADDYQTLYFFRDGAAQGLPEVQKWITRINTISGVFNNPEVVAFIDDEHHAGAFVFSTSAAPEIVEISFDTPVQQIQSIGFSVCGVNSDGNVVLISRVKRYVNNKYDTTLNSTEERAIIEAEFAVSRMSNVREIVSAPNAIFTISKQGVVDYHPSTNIDSTTMNMWRPPFARNTPIRYLVSSPSHALALTTAGELFAWGSNEYGACDIPRQLLQ